MFCAHRTSHCPQSIEILVSWTESSRLSLRDSMRFDEGRKSSSLLAIKEERAQVFSPLKKGLKSSRDKMKARSVVGRGEKSLLRK